MRFKQNDHEKNRQKSNRGDHYDLSRGASRRDCKGATNKARQEESDDGNEELSTGPVNNKKDDFVENKLGTCLDNE